MSSQQARWRKKRSWHSGSLSESPEKEQDWAEPTDIPTPGNFTNLGIGTWAWGDEKWGYGRANAGYSDQTLHEAFSTSIACGVTFFDTSEVYGGSQAETILGQCLHESSEKCFIATKWHPRSNASVFQKYYNDTVTESMRRTLMGSKQRLGIDCIDLFQLHSGSQCYGSLEDYADGLAAMIKEGHAKFVGVSNVGPQQVRRIHKRLWQAHGIQLFSNQVEFSLLEPGIASDGTLDTCRKLGVKVLAYCPLAMGRLTGKYSADNEPPFYGYGNKSYRYHGAIPWPQIEGVLKTCREIAEKRNSTVAQVALNWCVEHGTVPIPGAKTAKQAEDNCRTLQWRLDSDEVKSLNAVALSLNPST